MTDPLQARAVARALLALCLFAGTVVVILLAFHGDLDVMPTGLLALLALAALRQLPAGSRAAGWWVAVWAAATLIVVGRSPLSESLLGLSRVRLALMGGVAYLGLALTAFWACRGAGREGTE
ncbi:MAG: hypothetical protein Q9Q40_04325 [Acidobacteriota bacterium]|nr:hypothetical protein [Acidobacteriota bacterium]MDQ7087314.1 hypothetical protein [Acidobacteriota bacterium]